MGMVSDLLELLRRPLTPPPAAAADTPRKGRHPAAPAPDHGPDGVPVTEAELVAAIDRCAAEQAEAYALVAGRDGRREALLMQDGSDDAILALDADCARAGLTVERLGRLLPELQVRLDDFRELRKRERWIAVRDAYVAAGRKHLDVLREFVANTGAVDRELASALAEFQEAPVPAFPVLGADVAADFERRLDQLQATLFDSRRRAPKPIESEEERLRRGDANMVGAFGDPVPKTATEVQVQFEVSTRLNGSEHEERAGSLLWVRPDDARELVAAGQARIKGFRT